jgi:hypothetical protein
MKCKAGRRGWGDERRAAESAALSCFRSTGVGYEYSALSAATEDTQSHEPRAEEEEGGGLLGTGGWRLGIGGWGLGLGAGDSWVSGFGVQGFTVSGFGFRVSRMPLGRAVACCPLIAVCWLLDCGGASPSRRRGSPRFTRTRVREQERESEETGSV